MAESPVRRVVIKKEPTQAVGPRLTTIERAFRRGGNNDKFEPMKAIHTIETTKKSATAKFPV